MFTRLFIILAACMQIDTPPNPSFQNELHQLLSSSLTEYTQNEENLMRSLLSTGFRRNYIVSYALVSRAAHHLLLGDTSKAERYYYTASQISPDLPAVHFIYGNALRKTGISGTFQSFVPLFKYVVSKYSNPFTLEELKLLWLGEILIFIMIFSSLLTLVLLIKNFPRIYHFFTEILGSLLPSWGIILIIIFLLSIPFLLNLPPGYIIPAYLVFFSIFTTKREWTTKLIVLLMLIIFGSTGLITRKLSFHLHPEKSSSIIYIYHYYSGWWLQDMFHMPGEENEPSEKTFIRGLIFLKTGEYEKSKLLFEELLKKGFHPHKCLNNLGIAEYALGNPRGAEEYFKKSILTNDIYNPEAHYNLSVMFFSQAKTEEGKTEFDIAKNLMPESVEIASRFSSKSSLNLLFLSSELHPLEFINSLEKKSYEPVLKEILNPIFGNFSESTPVRVAIICALCFLFFHIPFLRAYFPNLCHRCERIYCRMCDDSPLENECGFCYTVYILKDKVNPEERIKFEIETSKRYFRRRWMGILSNAILPGTGHILASRTVRGTIISSAWLGLLLPLFTSGYLTRGLMPFSLDISFIEITGRLFLAFIIWILVLSRTRSWR